MIEDRAGFHVQDTEIFSSRRTRLANRKLGNFVLGKQLGKGRQGSVYRSIHPLLRRPVALKVSDLEECVDPAELQRRIDEFLPQAIERELRLAFDSESFEKDVDRELNNIKVMFPERVFEKRGVSLERVMEIEDPETRRSYQERCLKEFRSELSDSMEAEWRAEVEPKTRERMTESLKTKFTEDMIDEARERLCREARILIDHRHPSLVRTYDIFEEGPFLCLIMEYLEGQVLADVLDRCSEPRVAAAVVLKLLDALEFCHDKGIVHRDVKPVNIIIDLAEGEEPDPDSITLTLLDFGTAKSMSPNREKITKLNQFVGSENFAAPEQYWASIYVDRRADLYALSMVFYELLIGTSLADAGVEAYAELVPVYDEHGELKANPRLISTLEGTGYEGFAGIIVRGLQPKAADRFANAGEYRAALLAALAREEPSSEPEKAERRRPRLLWVAVMVIAAMAIAAAAWFLLP